METLFNFLIKASAGIALFYLVYRLFLQKETFHSANRWFLLAALFTSVAVPLFPVHYTISMETGNQTTAFQALSETFKNARLIDTAPEAAEIPFTVERTLLLIYFTGAVLFLLRLLTQTFVLAKLVLKNKIQSIEGIRIVENKKYGLPFSFFNVVFINPKFHNQENLPEILAHEKVHIREYHWFDLLITELLTVIFWFNPFIWLFEQSIKQNHEYLADRRVLSMGHGKGRYQALLVNQLMGMQIIGVTNNLNFALSTKRLKMMTKKKTPKIKGLKFLWALPAVAIILFACAEPNYKNESDPENSVTQLKKGEKEVSGIVVQDETGEPLPGVSIVIKGTTSGTVSDRDGTFALKTPENAEIVFSYVGNETITVSAVSLKSGNKEKVAMKEGVFHIIPDKYFKGEVPPPPPPPGEKNATAETENGNEGETFIIVEEIPEFPGGFPALGKYVYSMQEKLAQEKNVSGNALIGFTVDENGKVTKVKILEQDNDLAGETAALVVQNMKDWKPGSQRGKTVPVNMTLPIVF